MSDEKKCCWMVRPKCGGEWLLIETLVDLEDTIDAYEGEEFELKVRRMTDAEVDALGEFNGW